MLAEQYDLDAVARGPVQEGGGELDPPEAHDLAYPTQIEPQQRLRSVCDDEPVATGSHNAALSVDVGHGLQRV